MEIAVKALKFVAELAMFVTVLCIVWIGAGKAVLVLKGQNSNIASDLQLNNSDKAWQSYDGTNINGDKVNYFIEQYGDGCFFKVITRKNPYGFTEFSSRMNVQSLGFLDNASVFLCKTIFSDSNEVIGMLFVEQGASYATSTMYDAIIANFIVNVSEKITSLEGRYSGVNESLTPEEYQLITEYKMLYRKCLELKLNIQLLDRKLDILRSNES